MNNAEIVEKLKSLATTQTMIIVALAGVVLLMLIILFYLKSKIKDNKIAIVNMRMALNDTIKVVNEINAKK